MATTMDRNRTMKLDQISGVVKRPYTEPSMQLPDSNSSFKEW